MKTGILLAAALLAGCSGPPAREAAVATRLVLLEEAPEVGKPLRVRLDLVNGGPNTVIYDAQQADCNGSLDVVGPDGTRAPYIGGSFGTFGEYEELAPGTSRSIVEEIDVAAQYLILKPGRYTIRFSGRGLEAMETSNPVRPIDSFEFAKTWEPNRTLPSDPLIVEVRPGPVPEAARLAERLLAALPERWTLAWDPPSNSPDPSFTLMRLTGSKKDTLLVGVRVSSGPPEGEEKKEGELSGRNIYVASSARAEEAWPGHRSRLVAILNSR